MPKKTAAELAHERALAAEAEEVARSERLMPYLDQFDQSALLYINKELAKGTREDEDVRLLKIGRRERLRMAERRINHNGH